jgi:PAS domain S-box-containing protein
MTKVESANLAQLLQAVLRGAAKIVGCSSTHLVLFDEKSRRVRVHLGIMADAVPLISTIERLLGAHFDDCSWPMESAQGSLADRCWREAVLCETNSLKELAGAALPPLVLAAVEGLIGERRFACVPALSSTRNYGVLLFEKEGADAFNRQQREVLIRYAKRIGEILENDLMGQGQSFFDQLPSDRQDSLWLDDAGELRGHGPRGGAAIERALRSPALLQTIAAHARAFLATNPGEHERGCEERSFEIDGQLRGTLSRLDLEGRQGVLCLLGCPQHSATSLENQLVRLTLGDPAPALFVDPNFRITSCNPATAQLVGTDSGDLAGQPIGVLFSAPDEVMNILSHQVVDPRRAYSERATVVRCRDGSLVPVRVEALLLADDAHQLVGFLLVLRGAAKRDGDHLEQQERLATMSEMAAHLAHEIRNPLVAIGATLESLRSDPETPKSQHPILAALLKEILRMDMTLKDYLAARRELAVTRLRVGELVDEVRRLLEGAHRPSGKTIRCRVDSDLTIDADYEGMKQVVFNLLLNALEATPDEGEVVCGASRKGPQVAITVEDRGPGLPASPADCLRPFFTTKKNGTGLGLAVCQKIAHAHGGFLDLRNRGGGGCQATVVLPARRGVMDGAR